MAQCNGTGTESTTETAALVSDEFSRSWGVCWINEWRKEAILIQTKLSNWSEWRFGFMPFELNGSLNWGWVGLMHSTGWHRKDTQKPRDRILGLTKSAWCSGGSFPDLYYKCIDFTPYFIYLLVLQAFMKA